MYSPMMPSERSWIGTHEEDDDQRRRPAARGCLMADGVVQDPAGEHERRAAVAMPR